MFMGLMATELGSANQYWWWRFHQAGEAALKR